MITLFHRHFTECVLYYRLVWTDFSNNNRLGSLAKMASKVSGRGQGRFLFIYNGQVIKRANAILDFQDHPLQREFELLPLGLHFRAPDWRNKRLHVYFSPSAIDMLNCSYHFGCVPCTTLAHLQTCTFLLGVNFHFPPLDL